MFAAGNHLPGEQLFCCATRRGARTLQYTHIEDGRKESTMFCPKCGAQNSTGAAFCGRCGAQLQMPQASVAAPVDVQKPTQFNAPQVNTATAFASSSTAGSCPNCGSFNGTVVASRRAHSIIYRILIGFGCFCILISPAACVGYSVYHAMQPFALGIVVLAVGLVVRSLVSRIQTLRCNQCGTQYEITVAKLKR